MHLRKVRTKTITKKNVFSFLDPKIVAFLQAKKQVCKPEKSIPVDGIDTVKQQTNTNSDSDIRDESKINEETCINPYTEFGISKSYINMDVVEKDKLEWMTRLPDVSLEKVNAHLMLSYVHYLNHRACNL